MNTEMMIGILEIMPNAKTAAIELLKEKPEAVGIIDKL